MFNVNASTLIASLIWGSVGMGFCIYGKKQGAMFQLFGGIIMVALSYFVASALYMTLACVGLIALIFWLNRRF
jgi:hypothetical protein